MIVVMSVQAVVVRVGVDVDFGVVVVSKVVMVVVEVVGVVFVGDVQCSLWLD